MSTIKHYYVYIITNKYKTSLYIGVTNNLHRRLEEHANLRIGGFSNKYRCKYLVFYEKHIDALSAIKREKKVKKWNRLKKNNLINKFNPEWKFLNEFIFRCEEEFL